MVNPQYSGLKVPKFGVNVLSAEGELTLPSNGQHNDILEGPASMVSQINGQVVVDVTRYFSLRTHEQQAPFGEIKFLDLIGWCPAYLETFILN